MRDVELGRLAVVEPHVERRFLHGLLLRVTGHDKTRRARIAQARKRPLDIVARQAEVGRQPGLPSLTLEHERRRRDRLRGMGDPPPAENASAVGDEAVDSESNLFLIAHRCKDSGPVASC
jgi:hypothetical protein